MDWAALLPRLLDPVAPAALLTEVLDSLNASELARRRFREIARVSGLIFQSHPNERRSNKQMQASSALFYEVFRKYDPANGLLRQAEQELLQDELEIGRLADSLARMQTQTLVLQAPKRATPFAFPLMVERFREKLSNESLADRIARMVQQLETSAGAPVDADAADGAHADAARGDRVQAALGFAQEPKAAPRAARGPRRRRP